MLLLVVRPPVCAAELSFSASGKEFIFDTGALRGTLHNQGKSVGLFPVVGVASGTAVAKAYGLFSHYRLLDADARYGTAAWDWASESRLLPDGTVETRWTADAEHPFDLKAVYRWTGSNTLDVATTVTARQDLRRFESFLASYFEGFASAFVYTKNGFMEAKQDAGTWQAFPRDEAAVKIIGDGRWQRPPHPVDWKVMPALAGPLGMRRDEKTGLTGLVMAPPGDCFAVLTPFGAEGHRSLYLSLFGRDLKAGESATARARLVVGRGITDQHAVALYETYLKETKP